MTPDAASDDRIDDPGGDGLAWLAFRYAAGEFGADDSAAFERRLDADQSAREAVAEAVLLCGVVARAAPSARPRRLAAPLLGLAAATLVVAVGPWLGRPAPRARGVGLAVRTCGVPAGSVALAWSGMRQDDPPPDDLIAWLDDPAAGPNPAATGPDDAPEALPPWLLEAASLPDRDAPDAKGS